MRVPLSSLSLSPPSSCINKQLEGGGEKEEELAWKEMEGEGGGMQTVSTPPQTDGYLLPLSHKKTTVIIVLLSSHLTYYSVLTCTHRPGKTALRCQ